MGLFNKLMFWKKDDEFDFDKLADEAMKRETGQQPLGFEHDPLADSNRPLFPEEEAQTGFSQAQRPAAQSFSTPRQSTFSNPSTFQQSSMSSGNQPHSEREIELLNSKLDTIKAMLNSIDQRLSHIEQNSGGQQRQKLW